MYEFSTIINLFAGPGAGKSTTAAGVFYELKQRGEKAELVGEFAKDLTWEKRTSALEIQPYVFGKQLHRIERLLKAGVDFIVVDSPLLLSIVYNQMHGWYPESFNQSVLDIAKKFEPITMNFFLDRNNREYREWGRNQTEQEAIQIDRQILTLLQECGVEYSHTSSVEEIVSSVG